MARTYGRILSTIWRDPDWRGLSSDAQRVYLLALSQPDLRLTGVVPYIPQRWAAFAADTTPESIETAVSELEGARFVVVDRDTQELLVRSLCRRELTGSGKQLAGLWAAWGEIWSDRLRRAVICELKKVSSVDNLWTDAPSEAVDMKTAGHTVSPSESIGSDESNPLEPETESIVRETGDWRLETGTGSSEHGSIRSETETESRVESPPATSPPDTHTDLLDFELVKPDGPEPPGATAGRTVAAALDDLCGKAPGTATGLNQRRDDVRQLVATFARHDIPPTADSIRTLAGLYRADMPNVSVTAHGLANNADRLITQAHNGLLRRRSDRDLEDAQRQAEYAELIARTQAQQADHELEAG